MAARKKKPEAPSDGVIWRTTFRGTPIRLTMRDLTVQRLIQFKAWFGEQYAIPTEFLRLLFLNEAAAVMCAVWIGLAKAGKPVEDARELDFNLDEDFEALEDIQPTKEKEKEAPPTEGTTTGDSVAS